MFNVDEETTFTHTATIMVPVDGGHREDTITATFRVVPIDEVEKFDLATTSGNTSFLKAVLVKLDDLIDRHKKPVPYTDEIRDHVLNLPHARVGLTRCYFAAIGRAKEGN